MTLKKSLKRGFTLVELMIVVAIIGVLAALAVYGVRRYVFTAKTSEARTGVGRMAKDASNAFNAERMEGTLLEYTETAADSNALCLTATGTEVPSTTDAIQGRKYQSAPSEWAQGTQQSGWKCLSYSMQDPQYYQYSYAATGSTADGDTFTAMARGDLDGDGATSVFSLLGAIDEDSQGRAVKVAPNITTWEELE